MESKRRFLCLFFFGIFGCVVIAFLSLIFGSVKISPSELFSAVTGGGEKVIKNILLYSRLPRVIAAFLSGAALASSGAVLQQVLANKLASPSIIGVNAGAGLGVTISCALGMISGIFVSIAAFWGSLISVLIISVFSRKAFASRTAVILGGVALNGIFGALSESVAVLDADIAMLTTEFRVGGFSSVSYTRLIPAGIMIIVSLILLFTLCNELDVLSLGEETAKSLGMSVRRYRILFLILSALLAGAAVSFSGLLGFIGLIVPHFVRRLVGSESRRLMPLTVVFGAGFVCASDLISRVLFAPYELPVGMLLSLIGGPVFVWVLVRTKGEDHYA